MPPTPYPGFIGGSSRAQSPSQSLERTVNFYVERSVSPFGKSEASLYPFPGLPTFATVATETRGRAIFEEDGRCFAVIGAGFFEVFSDGTSTNRGTVAEGVSGGRARIAAIGDGAGQLFITAGDKGYCYTLATNVLTEVLVSGATQCAMLDGFAVVLDAATSLLQSSDYQNAVSFPALAVKQRDSASDPWLAMAVVDRLIYLVGERTTDIFYNAGGSPMPFEQHTAGAIPYGIIAPDSLVNANGTMLWLARSASGVGQVVAARGSSVTEIGDPSLHWAIEGYRTTAGITDAIGETFEYLGHTFYKLTFPAADATWVYNTSSQTWTEWLTWRTAEGRYGAERTMWHAVAFGKQLVCNRTTGEIHALDSSTVLDTTGTPARRLRRAPGLYNAGQKFTIDDLSLVMEPGIGAVGVSPLVTLNYSKDGGKTWNSAGTASAGAAGDYVARTSWPRLGTARDWAFEAVFSDNYPYRVFGADLTIRYGVSR